MAEYHPAFRSMWGEAIVASILGEEGGQSAMLAIAFVTYVDGSIYTVLLRSVEAMAMPHARCELFSLPLFSNYTAFATHGMMMPV